MSTDKTLADVQPGGRVRLGDQLPPLPCTHYNACGDGSEPLYTSEQMRDYARAALSAQPSPVAYHGDVDLKWLSGSIGEVAHRLSTYMPTGLAEWADRARDCRIAAQVLSELSAQPSPGGQEWPFVESPADFSERMVQALRKFDMLGAVRHVLIEKPPALAARQPVGQIVGYMDPDAEFLLPRPDGCVLMGKIEVCLWRTPSGKYTKPLYDAPAQAVDLGAMRKCAADALEFINHGYGGHARGKVSELLALIDSQA